MTTETAWCHGRPVGPIGFCEVCGRRRVPAEPPAASGPAPESTRRSVELWSGEADFQSLPAIEVPDPEKLVLADTDYPEQHRFCGHCGEPVGRAYAGEPAFAEGFCENCGERFSFLPKLNRGERLGDRYEVLGCFARGGLGWVYLAADTALAGQHVAIKGVINSGSAVLRAMARVERDVLVRLNHPNIVRVNDFVEHPAPGGEPDTYLVMEYVGGRSLRDLLKQGPPPRVEHVIVYGRAILGALDYLHGEGLLYCDMKPENVIHGDKRVTVIDLGAARPIGEGTGPSVGTEGFQAPAHELARHGLTVRSDLYTVGRTLQVLLEAAAEDADPDRVAGGLDSLRRVLERAVAPFERRFATAAEMAEQLDGVRREILSLRDERPRPVPSALFEDTAELLDDGLGAVPGLDHWVGGGRADGPLDLGLPGAADGAGRLPIPRVAPEDVAAGFIAAAGAPGPHRWLDKLAMFDERSVEIAFARTRALVALGDSDAAAAALVNAEELLGTEAARDWRAAWHHGLLALARDDAEQAAAAFDRVHRSWPGEIAPKLALGFCAELRGQIEPAERCYRSVWHRDHTQVSAAFGLARCYLRAHGRDAAIALLDAVPPISRHYDAARIAAVRIRAGRLPSGPPDRDDFADAARRLPELYLDREAQDRLEALVREAALAGLPELDTGRAWNGGALLGEHVTERGLRSLLEQSLRRLAERAADRNSHGVLVDLANSVRPKTRR
ncbi:serine/threonine-protein kinase [Amycolatopsis rifamycinica]|uniref:non-specific serine/threonine protein kinase n=1 Tax=Amycolatopsis rifamycinica TaxID=287986 RepID=A0A066UDY9_9PSEU|nr:serine/threonine-protein kinase [Amycolatopsis rifamycinica]KDN22443.1 serine/threonine protein kinase [Amycolatopsis rifamycinica]